MASVNYKKKLGWGYVLNQQVQYDYLPKRAQKAKSLGWNPQPHQYFDITVSSITVNKDYAWDGLTGWIDSEVTMRASLIHDALYQAIREGLLDRKRDRKLADLIFWDILRADGVNWFWACVLYYGVRLLG